MLGGVAGGVADYFNIDPTLVRVAFVLALIFGHVVTLILYLAAWLLVPESPY
jgi:phage shock protein PspC (stress-responsive transcriptional regulator)